jgi:hypothetical protein
MSLMPDPYVTSATINGNTITLKVKVNDFTRNEWVVISGQATQTNGAFTNFYEIRQVPDQPNGDQNDENDKNSRYISVTGTPTPHQFRKGEDISVFASVMRSWFTVLRDPTSQSVPLPNEVAGEGWTWSEARFSQVTGSQPASPPTAGDSSPQSS